MPMWIWMVLLKMENKFEHDPEEQGWKAPMPPRVYNTFQGLDHIGGSLPPHEVLRDNLCAWVCEKLSDLLDNDGSVRPEQAAGIYAHLAICRHCAQEWDEMQRVVSLVEKLPACDLPRDFAPLIMQRIENPDAASFQRAMPAQSAHLADAAASPAYAPAVRAQEQNAAAQTQMKVTTTTHLEQNTAALNMQQARTQIQQTQQKQQTELLQRMTAGGVLSSVLAYFLSTVWGRQMLGSNVITAGAWFSQVAEALRSVPILTWMAGLIFSAFAQLNATLGQTYHTMGAAAGIGFALDAIICVMAYGYLTARRRDAQLRY